MVLAVREVRRVYEVDARDDERGRALTRQHVAILRLVAEGKTDREIGRALGISHHTVAHHLGLIRARLGVANRTGAVIEALRRGWL